VLRREINGLLQESGAPTLDDLEDERKPIARYQETALHALGADAIATLQVRDALPTARSARSSGFAGFTTSPPRSRGSCCRRTRSAANRAWS
jgi:hypothetical protein